MEPGSSELGIWSVDASELVRVGVRLLAAMLLGAVVGYERERMGRWAGLRTHMLVSLGSALMVTIPVEAGLGSADVTRVIQGVATGIGFIGAGSILKLTKPREIQGLTTAAGIWVTSAVGMAAGLGLVGPAAVAVGLSLLVLTGLAQIEKRMAHRDPRHDPPPSRKKSPNDS